MVESKQFRSLKLPFGTGYTYHILAHHIVLYVQYVTTAVYYTMYMLKRRDRLFHEVIHSPKAYNHLPEFMR